MLRKIITIDQEKCSGCGLCADACHEGAIGIVNGKAKLLREDYCDGLGDCLPACPMDAISFEQREAPAYNEAAVLAAKRLKEAAIQAVERLKPDTPPQPHRCPGNVCQTIEPSTDGAQPVEVPGRLQNFPVQIKLLPPNAPFLNGADLLIAADCTAYAYGNFHHDFIAGRVTMIGCPKLDNVAYAEKLEEIFKYNDVKSVLVTRMQVPCCSGLSNAVLLALKNCGKEIPCRIVTITSDGRIPDTAGGSHGF